ncbi:Crp/Fnr family transcriptional regulator [Methylobacterium sp. ID0610]|uniref:Crp/Fnr family transcriptional regulator n=1 Tax=Methylobacterium carpenticola TaxID=3344827 RepID=UPI00367911A5
MSGEDFALLAPHLGRCTLKRGDVLVEEDGLIEHVSFPEGSISSIIASSPEGLKIEAGIVGKEGCVPLSVILGSDRSPHRIVIQLADGAYRIARPALIDAIEESASYGFRMIASRCGNRPRSGAARARDTVSESDRPETASLRNLLLRFVQVRGLQTNFTALSNAVHPIDERLARRLLMCHDRSPTNEMALTHDFLSLMLAVRRPSVTTALHVLEGNGFIRTERGHITIRDRRGLEEFAQDAYGRPEAEYRRLIGPLD